MFQLLELNGICYGHAIIFFQVKIFCPIQPYSWVFDQRDYVSLVVGVLKLTYHFSCLYSIYEQQ